jgi:lysophospholipase L1-like esterase
MNTNPKALRILCYGDSNTWGVNPETNDRHPSDVRWTGALQDKLGNDYEVIKSRTTNLDDPTRADRNGLTYLRPCLETHMPLDLCILWLGTNDMKDRFKRSAQDIAEATDELLTAATEIVGDATRFIVVNSPQVLETEQTREWGFMGAGEKADALGAELQVIAQKHNAQFVDFQAEGVVPDGKEGIHLGADMQEKIAELISKKITDH